MATVRTHLLPPAMLGGDKNTMKHPRTKLMATMIIGAAENPNDVFTWER